jgi:hypothetical protein
MDQTKELFLRFTNTINFELARGYAKGNCRRCYGRGTLEFKDVGAIESRWEYCSCARNNMKKYNQ